MENKKYTELLWNGKYQKSWFDEFFKLKEHAQANNEKTALAFQTVETINEPRFRGAVQKAISKESVWPQNYSKDWKNKLIWGDNKLVTGSLLSNFAGKVNLIYIDPPFFTGADFTIKTKVGEEEVEKEPSIIEARAYTDAWAGGMASYLRYMYERLVLMKELLAENGSIYVHLDWHVSHYVKVMMDEIFGYDNFRNEIVWHYFVSGKYPSEFARDHDIIYVYSKTENVIFNYEKELDKDLYYEKFYEKQIIKGKDGNEYYKYNGELRTFVKQVSETWNINKIKRDGNEILGYKTQKPEALLKRVIKASSNPGDIVADFFCGSGTTGVVAEKLGRRWIMADLSKYAIQVTRKRLLNINNTPSITKEDEYYGRLARPFEILNIGNYELEYFNDRPENYLEFILKLYNAEKIKGFNYLHGKKGSRVVHVGPLNAPISMDEIKNTLKECIKNNITKLDVLGWEWAYEVNELAKEQAKEQGIDLKLIQIPSINEIKSSLVGFDLKLLKMPDQIIDKALLKNVHFNEVSYLEIEKKVEDSTVSIKITDFQITQQEMLDEIKDSIKGYTDLIDYWAIDWEYEGDTFHNQWQSYRTKKEPKLATEAKHAYTSKGKHLVMVKVVDIFGNDTNKVLEVVTK